MPLADNQKNRVITSMNEVVYGMKNIFGNNLRQVILFDSYARGEQE